METMENPSGNDDHDDADDGVGHPWLWSERRMVLMMKAKVET